MSISTTLFGEISHGITGQLQNPWQMVAEPRLKVTDVGEFVKCTCHTMSAGLTKSESPTATGTYFVLLGNKHVL